MIKNIIKNTIFLSLLFILSGCTVSYEINIDEDKKVTDYLSVSISNELSGTYYSTPREYMESLITAKKTEFNLESYISEIEVGSDTSTAKLNNSFSSIEGYFNSEIIKYLYKNVSITKENNDIVILLNGMNDVMDIYGGYDENYSLTDFAVVLNSKYIIKDSNADEKNYFKGSYTWNYNKDSLGKNIELTITNNKNYFAIINDELGTLIIPIVILIIGVIIYIAYLLIQQKVKRVNQL